MDFKAELLALLGLPAEATDEQIASAVAAKKGELANCATTAQERDQLKNRAETAEARLAEHERHALEAEVEKDLVEFQDRITNRDEVKAALLANRAGTRKLLAALKPGDGLTEPLRNRREATAPDGDSALLNRRREREAFVAEVEKECRCASRAQAWDLARTRKPELFR